MRSLAKVYNWLAKADDIGFADVIFVLAGRECRKDFALRLFDQGCANTLLISVGRFEIRRFMHRGLPIGGDLNKMASAITPKARHYFITLQSTDPEIRKISIGRFGTWSEIIAFSHWLRERQWVRTGIVVSSGFHLKRLRWCCRFLVADSVKLRFVAVPDEDPLLNPTQWWVTPLGRNLVLSELLKVLVYGALLGPRALRRKRERCQHDRNFASAPNKG